MSQKTHFLVNLLIYIQFKEASTEIKACDINAGYVSRDNICCKVIFDCGPGHEIKPCNIPYEEEKCEMCPKNLVQPLWISSHEKERSCYSSDSCNGEARMTRRHKSDTFAPSHCQCNKYNCYYDDNHFCREKVDKCPVNQTMNESGVCVKCPKFRYKLEPGCGPCKMDINKWTESLKRNEAISVKTTITETSRSTLGYYKTETTWQTSYNTSTGPSVVRTNSQNDELNLITIIVPVTVTVVVGTIVLTVLIMCCRRKGNRSPSKKDEEVSATLVVKSPEKTRHDIADSNEKPLDSGLATEDVSKSANGSLFTQPSDPSPTDGELAVSGSQFEAQYKASRQISVDSVRASNEQLSIESKPLSNISRSAPVASIQPFNSTNTASIPSQAGEYQFSTRHQSNVSDTGPNSQNTEVKRSSFLASSAHSIRTHYNKELKLAQ